MTEQSIRELDHESPVNPVKDFDCRSSVVKAFERCNKGLTCSCFSFR